MKILMVCLGNICRSPVAEGVMKAKLRKYNIRGTVDSAGVISYHAGEQPDARAMDTALEFGIDISDQRARQFRKSDFHDFNLILTMDSSVHREIVKHAPDEAAAGKVQLFLPFAGIADLRDVPDPYYGGKDGFYEVFRLIDSGCEKIAEKILNGN